MCAIAGIIKNTDTVGESEILAMCNQMVLRGPDNIGTYVDGNIALGQCRLSIIDLETGNQPMFSSDGDIVVVYNGEIYNYVELKEELQGKYAFRTTSDTEVLIAGYINWGIDMLLDKIEGMFAICIYDIRKRIVYLARDRYGEKPLYYLQNKDEFVFASELKAFQPNLNKYSIDKKALNFYLALSYIPAPYTIYYEIRKLEASHYLKISEGNIENKQYYRLLDHVQDLQSVSYDEAKTTIRDLVMESVKKRMRSDVPIGAFLSGGIDSSIVSCAMRALTDQSFDTFTIGYDERDYDESKRAELVAKHIRSNHHCSYLHFNDLLGQIDEIIGYYDEPFADSSALPSFYVAQLAHQNVKMVLTGDSADEIFAGYEKYLVHYYADRYNSYPSYIKKAFVAFVKICPVNTATNNTLRKVRKLLLTANQDEFTRYFNMMHRGFNEETRRQLLSDDYYLSIKEDIKQKYDEWPTSSVLNREQYCDMHFVLEGCMFPKVDRACMHNSLESRTPVLDRDVIEYAFSINPEYKLKDRNKKRIFKDAFSDLLPQDTMKFTKRGFGVPIDYWLRNELKDELLKLIDKDFLKKQGLFNYDLLQEMFNKHLKKTVNYNAQLWNIFVFQKWYLNNIKTD